MRVAAVGLLDLEAHGVSKAERAALAQFQAALTHGHPTALAASDLTAFTVAQLVAGIELPSLTEVLRDYAMSQRAVYHAGWANCGRGRGSSRRKSLSRGDGRSV